MKTVSSQPSQHSFLWPCGPLIRLPPSPRKPSGKRQRMLNLGLIPIRPLAAAFYTILSWFQQTQICSVSDFRDTLFSIPFRPDSHFLFAFEWENPTSKDKQQYPWTVLPEGFRNSPHLAVWTWSQDLRNSEFKQGPVLPYT